MGRSNKAAVRRNRRLNRREKGSGRRPSSTVTSRPGLEAILIPDGRCLRNPRRPKNIWATEGRAAAALKSAQGDAERRGQVLHVERRYYLCKADEGGCGGYHLTSREAFIERPVR